MRINLFDLWNKPYSELPEFVNTRNLIYKCTNLVNGKSYVGQTSQSLYNRWGADNILSHKHARDDDRVISRAIRKYGESNFEVSIIETGLENLSDRLNREAYWIQYFHSYIHDEQGPGYNMNKGGIHNDQLREGLKKKYPGTNGVPIEAHEALKRYYPETNGAPTNWMKSGLEACKRKYGMNGANPNLMKAAHSPEVVRKAQASRELNYKNGLPPELFTKETKDKRNLSVSISRLFTSIHKRVNQIKELGLPMNLESYRGLVGNAKTNYRLANIKSKINILRSDSRWTSDLDELFSTIINPTN